jgi:adenosylmethionine-8-amino-7-oxononanoate aminotransferase
MVEYIFQKSIPDIVCFGKALTAGYFPLAVTLTSERIFDQFLGEYFEDKTKINYFIMNESLKMGVFLRSLGNIMIIIPPLAIDRNALEILLDTQFKLLQKIEKKV